MNGNWEEADAQLRAGWAVVAVMTETGNQIKESTVHPLLRSAHDFLLPGNLATTTNVIPCRLPIGSGAKDVGDP